MGVHVYGVSVCLSLYLARSLIRLFSFFFFSPAGIQLHHSSENGSSDYRKGKHGPWGFVYGRSTLCSPYITIRMPPPRHITLYGCCHIWGRGGGGGCSDFVIQLNTQVRGCLCS